MSDHFANCPNRPIIEQLQGQNGDQYKQLRELTSNQREIMSILGMGERKNGSTLPGRIEHLEAKMSEVADWIKEQKITNAVLTKIAESKQHEVDRKIKLLSFGLGLPAVALGVLNLLKLLQVI